MKIKTAIFDLDGTLLNRNNEVTLATRQAIARAVEHGVVVVPATGRPLASLPPVVAKLPGIRYAITSNGAAVWDLGDDPHGCCAQPLCQRCPAPHQRTRLPAAPPDADRSGTGSF